MNLLTALTLVGKVSGEYIPLEMNKCEVPFSDEEKSAILGTYQGKQVTLADFFSGTTSMSLKTKQDVFDYLNRRIDFAQKYLKAFNQQEYAEETACAKKARAILRCN